MVDRLSPFGSLSVFWCQNLLSMSTARPLLFCLLSLSVLLTASSCSNENPDLSRIRALEAQIDSTPPTLDQLNTLSDLYRQYTETHPDDTSLVEEFLSSAANIARAQGRQRRAAELHIQCIREFFTSPATPGHLTNAAVAIVAGILKYPPTDTLLKQLEQAFPSTPEMQATLTATLESIRQSAVSESKSSIQQQRFLEYASLAEVSALLMGKNPESARLFTEAAKTYHSLEAYEKALQLYNWVLQSMPESPAAPRSLFMKGYILENLGRLEAAQSAYTDFLATYPDDQLAPAAAVSLENLGKTPEQIVSEFQ